MKKTHLSAIVAIAMSTTVITGCFDNGENAVVSTDGDTAIDVMPESVASADNESEALTEQEASEQALVAPQVPAEQAQEDGFQKVSMSSQSTPESDDAFAAFMATPLSSITPTDKPDKGGVSNAPMKTNGTVVLTVSNIVPVNDPEYQGDNLVKCSAVAVGEAFYCSDQYLVQVQNSKNRIKIKDGSEIVLSPAANGLADNYILTYVKDNVASPSFYTLSPFSGGDLKVRYARVKNEACVYGTVSYLGQESSGVYNCYKASPPADQGITGSIVSGTANKTSFTESDLADMPKTSYDSFSKIQL